MTDQDDPQEPVRATPEQMQRIARKLILPHAIFVPTAMAACVWFVLYGLGGEGKKAAAEAQCEASRVVAARVAPLAKGEFAALAVRADPKPMPELAFNAPQGPATLASFKGKTILLNAWATWCVPCREEMPALDRLQGAGGVTVVALNVDTAKKERAKAFLGEIGAKSLGFYQDDDGKSFEALRRTGKVLGLPTTFVIGPDGCEIAALAGPAKWDGAQSAELVKALAASP
ncbi:Thiol-disulfide isomerase or thioredoxin [Rhodoblastus acidophilus]|uniref:Thiol-disulfide isomerase or thioredoxin n=1 Tax=Rhodoblastus acidophilus TaxID=1074 RepID=A0A212QXV8_RHOAC|nr:TlpA disulfide reductase family protein [Rhodoblastus acidophilus]PPQ40639.1 TlpA family protein disulfide reductase [Rhodoblastus acidophilus]RAI22991.1 hypothetical protein CH337_04770 [Rhodoblastus acidophilus]SNB64396.1 Thiol-disulfide isomerase or thioredoxin [Rhodoblastus acidophilus]